MCCGRFTEQAVLYAQRRIMRSGTRRLWMRRLFQMAVQCEPVDAALGNDDPSEKQSGSKPPRGGHPRRVTASRSSNSGRSRPRAPSRQPPPRVRRSAFHNCAISGSVGAAFRTTGRTVPGAAWQAEERHILADTLPLLLGVSIETLSLTQARRQFPSHPASTPDRDGIDDAGYNGLKI